MACYLTSPGPRFIKKMPSYQYRKFHCGDKTVVRSSYLHSGISNTSKRTSLYWITALDIIWSFGQKSCGTHWWTISQVEIATHTMSLKNTLVKVLQHISGDNEVMIKALMNGHMGFLCFLLWLYKLFWWIYVILLPVFVIFVIRCNRNPSRASWIPSNL